LRRCYDKNALTACYLVLRDNATNSMATKPKTKPRVTRSISFLPAHLEHLKKRAKAENRSVNFLVNELVRLDNGK